MKASRGRVQNGVVVLEDPAAFADGALVEVRAIARSERPHHPDVERFAGVLKNNPVERGDYYAYLRKKHEGFRDETSTDDNPG